MVSCRMLLLLCVISSAALASPPPAALPKTGSCPSGYITSGGFCKPTSNARVAVPKVGSCPSGYITSGAYCLASSDRAGHAVVKTGSCPSGYITSGAYCARTQSSTDTTTDAQTPWKKWGPVHPATSQAVATVIQPAAPALQWSRPALAHPGTSQAAPIVWPLPKTPRLLCPNLAAAPPE